jgi:hypothetical protein
MPSSISDFQLQVRNIKIKIKADLAKGTSYTYYNLDNYTILQTIENDGITGLFETTLDGELNIANPPISWTQAGIPIIAEVQVSNDNYATSYTATLFTGSTERQNSVPISKVKITASSLNSNYLDKRVDRQVFIDTDAHDIIDSLLTQAGVPTLSKSISASGVVVPVFYVSASKRVKEIISDILTGLLEVGGFDVDGVFRIRSISPLIFGTNGTTPEVTTTRATQFLLQQQNISSKYYCNTLTVKGKQKRYIGLDPFGNPSTLYFNNILQFIEIKPNSKLYYAVDMSDIEPESFRPFARVGEVFAPGTRSRFGFYTADDNSGVLDTSQVTLVSSSIAYDDDKGKDTIFLIFNNSSSSNSYYLKLLNIIGTGVQTTGQIIEERQDLALLNSDGTEIQKELSSDVIFDDLRASYCANILQLNYMQQADVYQFNIRGRPEIKVGTKYQFKDRANANVFSVVTEYDTECSIDRGYITKITTKKLNTNLQFFGFDDATLGLDDTNLQLL